MFWWQNQKHPKSNFTSSKPHFVIEYGGFVMLAPENDEK
jgi:hypothetical protein